MNSVSSGMSGLKKAAKGRGPEATKDNTSRPGVIVLAKLPALHV